MARGGEEIDNLLGHGVDEKSAISCCEIFSIQFSPCVSLPLPLYSTIRLTMSAVSAPASPVSHAFPHIQWDALTSLRLTAQETALLRMAETNPIDYTLADSRDASMYARVLLKLLAEACSAGAGTGKSHLHRLHRTCKISLV